MNTTELIRPPATFGEMVAEVIPVDDERAAELVPLGSTRVVA